MISRYRDRAVATKRPRPFTVLVDSRDRDRWLAARSQGLGASEVSALYGVNPFESPFSLWSKKLGLVPPEPDNPAMSWGRKLERIVGETFSEETGRRVWVHPLAGRLLRSRRYPWLLATPDFEQRDPRLQTDGLLEVKTTNERFMEDWANGAPLAYQIQVQQQLLVSGRLYASIAVLIGGQTFRYVHVKRDEAFLKTLINKSRRFWEMVQTGEPPPVDASESTIETLKQMKEDGRAISLPKDVLSWHDRLLEAAERRKTAEQEEKEAKREISALLGTATRGLMPNGEGMYRFETRKAYDVAAHRVPESRILKFTRRTDV